jgi:hypothetical protein
MNKEKLQQVIDALKSCGVSSYDGRNGDEIEDQCYDEDLVKEALAIMQAEMDKQLPEPLGEFGIISYKGGDSKIPLIGFKFASGKQPPVGTKLYAEPPARKREESYSDALRSLASYVGCGGYNADDPIDAKEFEERIRFGIDLMLSTAQSQPCVRKPLTDEQIIDLYFDGFSMGELLEFARAIEAAHGIKE